MQEKQKYTGLVWFRNDLRIGDNEVLEKAANECQKLIAVYCISPRLTIPSNFGFRKMGVYRAKFLLETLSNLQKSLAKKRTITLVVMNMCAHCYE